MAKKVTIRCQNVFKSYENNDRKFLYNRCWINIINHYEKDKSNILKKS